MVQSQPAAARLLSRLSNVCRNKSRAYFREDLKAKDDTIARRFNQRLWRQPERIEKAGDCFNRQTSSAGGKRVNNWRILVSLRIELRAKFINDNT